MIWGYHHFRKPPYCPLRKNRGATLVYYLSSSTCCLLNGKPLHNEPTTQCGQDISIIGMPRERVVLARKKSGKSGSRDVKNIRENRVTSGHLRYGEDSREEALSKQTLPFWTQLRVATWNIMGPMVPWLHEKLVIVATRNYGTSRNQWSFGHVLNRFFGCF